MEKNYMNSELLNSTNGINPSLLRSTIFAQPEGLEVVNTVHEGGGRVITAVPGLGSTDNGDVGPEELLKRIHVAIRMRNCPAVMLILEQLKSQANISIIEGICPDGHSLMHWAAKDGNVKMLELLHSSGCNLELKSSDSIGMYPIHWACTSGNLYGIKWLKTQGVNLNCCDNKGCTPLIIAAQYGFVEIVIFLLKAGARPDILDENNDSALHWAAYKGHVPVMVMLLKMGFDMSVDDAHGQAPLHLASLRGNLDAVEYLVLEAKADTQAKDKYGKTPLDLAIKKKMVDVEFFLRTKNLKGINVVMECIRKPALLRSMCQIGQSGQGSRWPFLLNLISMVLAGTIAIMRFFDVRFVYTSYAAVLLTAMLVAYTFTWIFLGIVYFSDPGYITASQDQALSSSFQECMDNLMNNDDDENAESRILCYTCSLERPIRSKHCRVCRKCVRCFDHHCAFVRNCIGLRNYGFFYIYVVLTLISSGLYTAICILWLKIIGFDWLVLVSCIYVSIFLVTVIGLFQYHTHLISQNLTTNEHQNWHRYGYLRDSAGRYSNPFKLRSFCSNFASRVQLFDFEEVSNVSHSQSSPLLGDSAV